MANTTSKSDQDALVSLLQEAASNNDQTHFRDLASQAARSGNATALTAALGLGADPKDLLIKALDNGSPEICACLFDAGGLDVNYRMPGYSGNPLTCAAGFAKVPLIKYLLSKGADPNMENCGWGQFQLKAIAAAADGWTKDAEAAAAVEVLLEGGARWEGSGALQVAAREGKVECVSVLVGRGADVNEVVERVEARSAIKCAVEKGHGDIVSVLRTNGAKE